MTIETRVWDVVEHLDTLVSILKAVSLRLSV